MDTDGAILLFLLHKKEKTNDEGYYAMEAIKLLASENRPMLPELMPYVIEACEAWSKEKGTRVKTYSTRMKWQKRVSDVHLLRKSGYKKEAALTEVSIRDDIKIKTLKRRYNSSDYKNAKESADTIYTFNQWDYKRPEDYIDPTNPKNIISKKVQ